MSELKQQSAAGTTWSALPAGAVIAVVAVASSLGVSLMLVRLFGGSIPDTINAFWNGVSGSSYAVGASLNRAVTLALIGLGFVFANRANLVNVGGEGQICLGGMAATAVAVYGSAGMPPFLAVVTALTAGAAAGAFWGAIAGGLLVKRQTNEVISTLLLSFIGIYLVYWSVESEALLRKPRTGSSTQPESLPLPPDTHLPSLFGDPDSPLHIGLPIAIVAAIAVGVVLSRTAFGLRLKAIGLGRGMARRAGLNDEFLLFAALAVAGAFGGLAGAIMIQGEQHVLRQGFSSNFGFSGVVVGLLARGSASAVIAFAILLGFLRSGGIEMEISAGVPSALVLVCQGLIVIVIAGSTYFVFRNQS
jgi:general nucleoside transport system permease protein